MTIRIVAVIWLLLGVWLGAGVVEDASRAYRLTCPADRMRLFKYYQAARYDGAFDALEARGYDLQNPPCEGSSLLDRAHK